MTNSEILAHVTRREITPEEAADLMPDEPQAPWLRLTLSVGVALLLILGVWVLLAASTSTAQAPRYTRADGLLAAQACVSESTWSGASTSNDCGGIIAVVEARRGEHESFSASLRRAMPRFTAGRTDRLWALHLPYGPITANPEGWPYTYGAAHHSAQWRAVVERVHSYMMEGVELPCSPTPISWLGRQTDGHVLAERLATGRWREADCGLTTNAFIYLADLD